MARGTVALAVALAVEAWATGVRGAPSPELPQVRVSRVQADPANDWRIFLAGLKETGKPFELVKHRVQLFLAEGARVATGGGAAAFASFDEGAGKGGRMYPLGKADVVQAVVFVVAVHAEVPLETWDALDTAVVEVAKGLRPDAQVGVVFYGDRVSVLWSVDGKRADVRSINEFQYCLEDMRVRAARPGADTGPGVPCGRLFSRDALIALLDKKAKARALPPRQGLFPRLFGIGETNEVEAAAAALGHERLDRKEIEDGAKGGRWGERFAEGAIEAAARVLLAATPPSAVREVVVLSDGRDGYLRVAEVAQAHAGKRCAEGAQACKAHSDRRATQRKAGAADAADEGASPECTREVLECAIPKVAGAMRDRETAVRAHLESLVGLLRAGGIRVFAIAVPGADEVGVARLNVLSLKTGGTFRDASSGAAGELQLAAERLQQELASEVVVVPGAGLDPRATYTVTAVVDKELAAAPHTFRTGARRWPLEGKAQALRTWMIAKLGHGWGPPAFWGAALCAALLALSLSLTIGKVLKGLVKKAGGKVPKPPKGAAPPVPKMPALKRPPLPR